MASGQEYLNLKYLGESKSWTEFYPPHVNLCNTHSYYKSGTHSIKPVKQLQTKHTQMFF